VSDEVGLIVLAVVFAVGVALFTLLMISLLPGVLLVQSRIAPLLDRWKKPRGGSGQATD
jgi:hypothetical protein